MLKFSTSLHCRETRANHTNCLAGKQHTYNHEMGYRGQDAANRNARSARQGQEPIRPTSQHRRECQPRTSRCEAGAWSRPRQQAACRAGNGQEQACRLRRTGRGFRHGDRSRLRLDVAARRARLSLERAEHLCEPRKGPSHQLTSC